MCLERVIDLMKIGILSKKYERWGDECYKRLKACGFDYIHFDMCDTETEHYLNDGEEFKNRILRERKLIEEAGIVIDQVHGPWRSPVRDGTPEERAERMEKMKKSIYATALLGCKNWVIHPIMPYGIYDRNTKNAQKTWDLNIEFMSELLETAKVYDVTICYENMPMNDFSIATPAEILKFVKTINDAHFKICLDTGHAAVFKGITPADAVRELGDEIRVLHIHDNNGQQDQHLLPYFGIIDWKDFGQALKEVNYDGVFCYETEPPANLPDSIFEDMSRMLVKLGKEILGMR